VSVQMQWSEPTSGKRINISYQSTTMYWLLQDLVKSYPVPTHPTGGGPEDDPPEGTPAPHPGTPSNVRTLWTVLGIPGAHPLGIPTCAHAAALARRQTAATAINTVRMRPLAGERSGNLLQIKSINNRGPRPGQGGADTVNFTSGRLSRIGHSHRCRGLQSRSTVTV
jgi:hypothetical protein